MDLLHRALIMSSKIRKTRCLLTAPTLKLQHLDFSISSNVVATTELASTYKHAIKQNVGGNGLKCPQLQRWYESFKSIGMHAIESQVNAKFWEENSQ